VEAVADVHGLVQVFEGLVQNVLFGHLDVSDVASWRRRCIPHTARQLGRELYRRKIQGQTRRARLQQPGNYMACQARAEYQAPGQKHFCFSEKFDLAYTP
jgi:hypothetical protein